MSEQDVLHFHTAPLRAGAWLLVSSDELNTPT